MFRRAQRRHLLCSVSLVCYLSLAVGAEVADVVFPLSSVGENDAAYRRDEEAECAGTGQLSSISKYPSSCG